MMRNTVLTIAAGTLTALTALAVSPAQAQYTNPYTGRTFNNPNSSLLDTAILGASRSMMLSNSLFSGSTSARILAQQVKLGQQIIKRGKATTRYTARNPFPMELWLKRVNPSAREQWAAEANVQKTLWDQEARARGANMNDMADALGLTFIMGWEAQTGGQKATTAQFKGISADFRQMLLKDAYFQGMSQADRQMFIEGKLLDSSDKIRLLREAKRIGDATMLQQARDGGKKVTDSWLPKGKTHYVPNPSGFTDVK
ncbi:MAG: hypothetical protein QM758_29675 [Armatimonas sp.]